MIKLISVGVAVTAASVLAAGLPAGATAPGANGQIVFRRYLATKQPTSALFIVNPDGTGERQVTRPTKGITDNHPSWSPDASKIVFERCAKDHCEVWTVGADGAGLRRLGAKCHKASPTPTCDERGAPAWSPGGQAIVMNRAYGHVNPAVGIKYSGLALTDPSGGHLRNVVISKPYAGDLRDGAWSPDGARVVLTVNHTTKAKPANGEALFLINADGTGLHRLTPWKLRADQGSWSPDGQRIIFRSTRPDDETFGGGLYTIHPDGTALTQLIAPQRHKMILRPAFSPDGSSIAFAGSGAGGEPEIVVANADGTNARIVTNGRGALPGLGSAPLIARAARGQCQPAWHYDAQRFAGCRIARRGAGRCLSCGTLLHGPTPGRGQGDQPGGVLLRGRQGRQRRLGAGARPRNRAHVPVRPRGAQSARQALLVAQAAVQVVARSAMATSNAGDSPLL